MSNRLLKIFVSLSLLVSIAGCKKEAEIVSHTWDGEDGDSVEIFYDVSDGYELTKNNSVFEISKKDELLSKIFLVDEETYDKYDLMSNKGKILKEGEINGFEYTFYEIEDEYYHIFWLGTSDTGVIVYNNVSKKSAKECFSKLSVELKSVNETKREMEKYVNEQAKILEYLKSDNLDFVKYFDYLDKIVDTSDEEYKTMSNKKLNEPVFMIDGKEFILGEITLSELEEELKYKPNYRDEKIYYSERKVALLNSEEIQFIAGVADYSFEEKDEKNCNIYEISQTMNSMRLLIQEGKIIFPGGLAIGDKVPDIEKLKDEYYLNYTSKMVDGIQHQKYKCTGKTGNSSVVLTIEGLDGIIVSLNLKLL